MKNSTTGLCDVSTLLNDVKYAKSVLVSSSIQTTEKFTLYKIILKVSPIKSFDGDSFQYKIWRRYRDVRKLHLKMELLHKQLYLKGHFPVIAPAEYFGRLEPAVVEERKKTIENFLNFVVQDSVLVRADELHVFFQGAEKVEQQLDPVPNAQVLLPTLAATSEDFSEFTQADAEPSIQQPTVTIDNLSPSTHPRAELSIFDPCSKTSMSQKSVISNFDLLSDIQITPTESDTAVERLGISTSDTSISTAIEANQIVSTKLVADKDTLKVNVLRSVQSTGNLDSYKKDTISSTSSWIKKLVASPTKESKSHHESSDDYLVQAAEFISAAQKSESEGVYDFAFTLYKSAVLLLLNGVQEEKDANRRNAVRVQTTKYLRRTEKLYKKYLATETDSTFVIESISLPYANILGLQGNSSELKHYLCLKILGYRVQLVKDLNTSCLYAMKFIDKCTNVDRNVANHVFPSNIPHMVSLVRFWELDHYIVLLLEYAENGCLWDKFSSYFKQKRQEFVKLDLTQFRSPKYNARKVLYSVGGERSHDHGSSSIHVTDNYDDKVEPVLNCKTVRMSIENFDEDVEHIKFLEWPNEMKIQKWTAQLVVALNALHSQGIICRDLNTRNLLLDHNDDILLSYFSGYNQRTTVCTESVYLAPEIGYVKQISVDKSCDFWSLGIILYELVTGLPMYIQYPHGLTDHTTINLKEDVSAELKDLISKLIRFDVDERMGCTASGCEDVLKQHPFFDGIHWDELEQKS